MPLLLTVAWSWMSSMWGTFLLPLLAKIPWQVWAGIGLVIAFLWYGHVRENRGYDKCHVEVETATNKETTHRLEAANASITEAQIRASESARRASQLQEDNDGLQKQVGELKTAKTVCLPHAITDQYTTRGMRKLRE